MAVTGGCLCGAVRYSVDAEPITTRACWCRDCQRWASGNAAVNIVFPSATLRISGEVAEYVSTADSGNTVRRGFCPKCGTPITSKADVRPHIVVLRVGTLDDPSIARPQAYIWTASAPPWGHIDPDCAQFEGQPPPPPAPRP